MAPLTPSVFSRWMRGHLKDAYSGLITQDIDFFVRNARNDTFLLIEEKTSNRARSGPAQAVVARMINDLFKRNRQYGGYLLIYTAREHVTIKKPQHRRVLDYPRFFDLLTKGEYSVLRYDWFTPVIQQKWDILWDCRQPVSSTKTEPERSGLRPSFLREKFEEFASQTVHVKNIHWIFVNYCSGLFLLLEEQESADDVDLAESEKKMVAFIHRLFKQADAENRRQKMAKNLKSGSLYQYLGYHLLEYEHYAASQICNVRLNHQPIDLETLTTILNLDSESAVQLLKGFSNREMDPND